MIEITQQPAAQALAWTLVHFLWQGAVIGLVAFGLIRLARQSASVRYGTGVVALGLMLLAPVATFGLLFSASSQSASPIASPAVTATESPLLKASGRAAGATGLTVLTLAASPEAAARAVAPMPAVIIAIWALGVVILSLRLLGGWIVARRLATRATKPVGAAVQAAALRVAAELGLSRAIRIMESSAVSVPVMIGWLKPVVLFPAAALSGLSIDHVEAVLAHELAHIRRHDYLVNLLQAAVETLLFYHPAVWLISRQVRVDREDCCDDVALAVCDRVVYATALTELAALSVSPRLALAATDGSLLNRVRRILGRPVVEPRASSGWLSAIVLVLVAGSVAPSLNSARAAAPSLPKAPLAVEAPAAPPAPEPPQQAATPKSAASSESQAPKPNDPAAADAAAAKQRELDQQYRDLLNERASIDRRKIELEMEQSRNSYNQQLDFRMQQVDSAKKQLEAERRKVEIGLEDKSQLAEAEAALVAAQQRIDSVKNESRYALEKYQLQMREVDLGMRDKEFAQMKENADSELNSALFKSMAAKAEMEKTASLGDAQSRDRQKLELLLMNSTTDASPDTQIRAGDALAVTISGEPDLPRFYVVQADGSIRLPLLGSIPVKDLTAKQVQGVLVKNLTKGHLAEGATVEVSIRRQR